MVQQVVSRLLVTRLKAVNTELNAVAGKFAFRHERTAALRERSTAFPIVFPLMSLARRAQTGNEKFAHNAGNFDPCGGWLSLGTILPWRRRCAASLYHLRVTTMSHIARTSSRRRSPQLRRIAFDALERRELLSIEPISLANPSYIGPTANDMSGSMPSLSVSADGRYVAFVSDATNLTPGDTNALPDLYRYDRSSGTMTLISADAAGNAAGLAAHDSDVRDFTMTPDGKFIAFVSDSLLPDQGNVPTSRLFVRDVAAQQTTLVSVLADGSAGAVEPAANISISSDGRYVAFESSLDGYLTGVTPRSIGR